MRSEKKNTQPRPQATEWAMTIVQDAPRERNGRQRTRIRDEEGVLYLHFNLHIKTCFHDRSTRVREIRYLALRVRRISRSKAELYTTAKATRRPWDRSRMPILKYALVDQRLPDLDTPYALSRSIYAVSGTVFAQDTIAIVIIMIIIASLRCETAALAIALLNPPCITLTHIVSLAHCAPCASCFARYQFSMIISKGVLLVF